MQVSLTNRPLLLAMLAVIMSFAMLFVQRTIARDGASARQMPSRGSATSGRSGGRANSESAQIQRLREGTVISDQAGFFREDGEGATFVSDDGHEFGALPNLNLERVLRLLKSAEESSSIRWNVTGEVTEFSGRNFLLISRAVYKSATPPPVPEKVLIEAQ